MNASFLGFFAHAGFLAGLEEIGLRPAKVAGASAGALAGGLYAAGLSSEQIHAFLFDSNLKSQFVEKRSFLRGPSVIAGLRGASGVVTGDKIARHLRALLGDRKIEDCEEPQLGIALTNLTLQQSEIATSGDLVENIVASLSFPGIFATRRIGEHDYWDGGIAQPMPFDHWTTDASIDTILLHRVNSGSPEQALAKSNVSASFNLAHEAVCKDLFRLREAEALAAGKKIIVIETNTARLGIFDRQAQRLGCYADGLATARENSEQLRSLAAGA
jgi:NTE family protein